MLRPDDTLHFFTSPYRRTRETTQGILRSLTALDPTTGTPSPYPRDSIKVYEEPRLREQDFGNFQPCSAEMERMWQERADYGHFFYRIPNGESAADAYDRVSGFNETLWRLFGEEDFASVCVLVTHGLMARVFLMKWYHFSVEYFEDLRNIGHCEFVIMDRNEETDKYALMTELRTWSQLKRELALKMQRERATSSNNAILDTVTATATTTATTSSDTSPVTSPSQACPKWGGCPDGCDHDRYKIRKRKLLRKNTRDILYEYDQKTREGQTFDFTAGYDGAASMMSPQPEASVQDAGDSEDEDVLKKHDTKGTGTTTNNTATAKGKETAASTTRKVDKITRSLAIYNLAGRDGGGSQSGAESHVESEVDTTKAHRPKRRASKFDPKTKTKGKGKGMGMGMGMGKKDALESPGLRPENQGVGVADSLGDRDDENEGAQVTDDGDVSVGEDSSGDEEVKAAHEKAKRYDRSVRGSVY